MTKNKNPYISRVQIKNFRNFIDVDVVLDHKQVIIGENNVGKTNFLKAIQLILDKDLSDNDRQLTAEDFHDSLENPLEMGHEIEINLEIEGYEHSKKLIAQFADAVISDNPPTLKFTYKFFPNKDEHGSILNYKYELFKGNNEQKRFTNEDRNYINIYVIKALRDVERELKANKNSPLFKLVKQYEISLDDLEEISTALKEAAGGILKLDEIEHIKNTITGRFSSLSGLQVDNEITLRTFDIDTERLLYTLQVYMGLRERPVSELSLGLANILFVSLMLILLKDKTVLPIIKPDKFELLLKEDKGGLLKKVYEISERGNFILNNQLEEEDTKLLYAFMDEHNYRPQAFTILAVEEPESHLHPVLQRLIYKEVLHSSDTSVIFTSHSTFITSVSPLNYMVHVRRVGIASKVFSTAKIAIDIKEKKDIERYVDAKRGEIYFGKGIIITEGVTEEYVVPALAELLGTPLDDFGIVVCNIDSINFKPYVKLLNILNIPWILITDGDYYEIRIVSGSKSSNDKTVRIYHIMETDDDGFYRGNEIVKDLLLNLGILTEGEIPEDYVEQDKVFRKKGCFIGRYTFEVDMMNKADEKGIQFLKSIYNELKSGGNEMQENFEEALDSKNYWAALNKIDNNIGKGRFAQRLANDLIPNLIPVYVQKAITAIIKKVNKSYE